MAASSSPNLTATAANSTAPATYEGSKHGQVCKSKGTKHSFFFLNARVHNTGLYLTSQNYVINRKQKHA
jgi:hypothetical protein